MARIFVVDDDYNDNVVVVENDIIDSIDNKEKKKNDIVEIIKIPRKTKNKGCYM